MRAECPVCGNDRENLTNKLGQWQCGACKHIWHPSAPKPAPAAAPVAEEAPVAQPAQRPARRPRENAAQQIRLLHAHLRTRLPEADDAVLRELALDLHQLLANVAALGSIQAVIEELGVA